MKYYQQPRYSLQESLYKLGTKYDKQSFCREKIAQSILIPTYDSYSMINTCKHIDKPSDFGQKSRFNRSKMSHSVGRRTSKVKNQEKEQEISYYKILYEKLRDQNQRLKYNIKRKKSCQIAKPSRIKSKLKKESMNKSQIQYLTSQIQTIEKRFAEDKQKPSKYEGFYKKFISEFKHVNLSTPHSIEEAWNGWQRVRKRFNKAQQYTMESF